MRQRIAAVSIVDAIASDVRSRVFGGELAAGAALTEAEVAATYEVARPTAKAAIEKLVAEGLLQRGIHKTARVVELGPESVRDIYDARLYLESEILRRLARDRTVPPPAADANAEIAALASGRPLDVVEPDMRFHESLVAALGNERISRMYRSLVGEVRLCMSRVQSLALLETELICAEHARILELLAEGRGEEAATLLDEHLSRARERLVEALGGEPGPESRRPSSVLAARSEQG